MSIKRRVHKKKNYFIYKMSLERRVHKKSFINEDKVLKRQNRSQVGLVYIV